MIHVKACIEVFPRPTSFSYPEVKDCTPVVLGVVRCLFAESLLRNKVDGAGPVTLAHGFVWIVLGQSDFTPALVSCTTLFLMKLAEIPGCSAYRLCDMAYCE